MKHAYLLVYSDNVGTRDQVRDVLDSMPSVTTWRYDIPHSFYVISEYSAEVLSDEFVTRKGSEGRFMFARLADDRYGMMLPETWYLLGHKHHKPKDD